PILLIETDTLLFCARPHWSLLSRTTGLSGAAIGFWNMALTGRIRKPDSESAKTVLPSEVTTILPARFSGSCKPRVMRRLAGSLRKNRLTFGRAGGFCTGAILKAE